MAFTELCCRSGGSNLNAGTLDGTSTEPGTSAAVTYTGGDWNATTDIYTAPVGADMTAAVVGRFASLYHDGDTAPTTNQYLVGRITAVNAGTRQITIDSTARSQLGTEVATGTGNRSMRIGGAWAGCSGSSAFPIGFVTSALTNAAGDKPCVNFKTGTYSITAAMTHSLIGPVRMQGYNFTYRDGGRFTIDGGTSGASYALLTLAAGRISVHDLILANNGATGSASGLVFSAATLNCTVSGVVAHDLRGNGIDQAANSGGIHLAECEAYNCNQSNTASKAGIYMDGGTAVRCIAHDNSGSNTAGFLLGGGSLVYTTALIDCIADTNGSHGANFNGTSGGATVNGGAFYNNGGDGIRTSNAQGPHILIENAGFEKNGGYGINGQANTSASGMIRNCSFGSGTQANSSGQTNVGGSVEVSGSVTLPANTSQWIDPANGDFRNNLAAVKGTGRGTFTQTASGYSGTVSYPDIALQHQDSGGPRFGLAGSGPSFRGAV